MELDARAYGGDLEALIHKQEELDGAQEEAARDAEHAKAGLSSAREADVGADVKAILDGGDGADARSEPSAAEALRLAERNSVVASRARLTNLERLHAEAQDEKYVKRLASQEEKLTKAALSAVATVEKLLDDIGNLRASRNWL